MKKICTLITSLLLLLSTITVKAQNWQWAYAVNAGVGGNRNVLEPDGSGNFYLGVNSGVGTCLIKFDAQGNELWRKCISGSVVIKGLAANAASVFVTGHFTGSLSVPGYTLTGAGLTDGFLLNMDNNGNVTWARSFGGPGNDEGADVVIDPALQIQLTGTYEDTCSFGGTLLTCSCTSAAFLAKYNLQGNLLNIKSSSCLWSPSSFATGQQIMVDRNKNTFLLGTYSYFTWDTTVVSGGGGPYDIWYITKLDSSWNVLYAHKTVDNTVQYLFEMALDTAQDIILNGYHMWTIGGTSNTVKLNSSDGNIAWDSGSAYYCPGDRAITEGVAVQNSDSYIFGVNYLGTNCSPGRTMRLLAKYDGEGQVKFFDTVLVNVSLGNFDIVRIAPSAFVVTGVMSPGTQVFGTHTVTAYDEPKLFIARFDDTGNYTGLENTGKQLISVFPNPTSGNILVSHNGPASAKICDLTGKVLITVNETQGPLEIGLKDYPAGIYLLSLNAGGVTQTMKVIKIQSF